LGVAYRCDAATGCTFIVWDAEVTPGEWTDREQEMFADPGFPPGPVALVDLRSAAGAPMVPLDVVNVMGDRLRSQAPKIGPIRMALIPNSSWDKVRAFEERLEGSGISSIAFTSVATACTWLGIDGDNATAQLQELREKLRS
jgi:hypothetical protein